MRSASGRHQRDPALKEAVEVSLVGDVARVFGKLGENVAEVKPDNLAGAAAARWLALSPEQRANAGLMAPSHGLRERINEIVRERLVRDGGRSGAGRGARTHARDAASRRTGDDCRAAGKGATSNADALARAEEEARLEGFSAWLKGEACPDASGEAALPGGGVRDVTHVDRERPSHAKHVRADRREPGGRVRDDLGAGGPDGLRRA